MLDFGKGKFHKYRLSKVDFAKYKDAVSPILTEKEEILSTFEAGRDGVIFTTKRLIAVDNENHKKTDITSIPYSCIDVFSVENAGWMDRDAELDIFIKGIGEYTFEFDRDASMATICKYISIAKFD